MIFCIDFDGTCVKHYYPEIGEDVGAIPVLKELVQNGHQLILWTMRSDNPQDKGLTKAVKWFQDNEIPLWGVNQNPEQHTWTKSPKAYSHYVIDDTAIGVPLVKNKGERSYVDWVKVRKLLVKEKLI